MQHCTAEGSIVQEVLGYRRKSNCLANVLGSKIHNIKFGIHEDSNC